MFQLYDCGDNSDEDKALTCRVYLLDLSQSQEICPPIFQIVPKNFIKISLIIKECPEEILIKLAFVLKISNLAIVFCFGRNKFSFF
jgi:hypothetical protein